MSWRDGDVRGARVERLGAIVLAERPLRDPDPAAWRPRSPRGCAGRGSACCTWTPAARRLRARLAAAHAGLGEPWPAVDDDALLAAIDVSGARSRADLTRLDVVAALRALVPWQLAGDLDAVVPDAVTVPTGSRIRVDYTDPAVPTLSVRVQEVFGWAQAPLVAGRPLRLQLLSPAQRVVATTADLAGFWVTGYPAVRSELRGRYPRHPWPEDPAAAPATKRARHGRAPEAAGFRRPGEDRRVTRDTDDRRVGHRRELAGRARRGARGRPGDHRAAARGHRARRRRTSRSGRRSSPAPATPWRSTRPRSSARTARCGTSTASCPTTSRSATTGCSRRGPPPPADRLPRPVLAARAAAPGAGRCSSTPPAAGTAGASATSPTCAPSAGWPPTRAPASC